MRGFKFASPDSSFCVREIYRLDYSYLRLTLNTPGSRKGAREFIDHSGNEAFFSDDDTDSTALSWVDGGVDWGKLFDGLRSRNAYSENDFIPGAT